MTIDVWMQHPTAALPRPRHVRLAAALDGRRDPRRAAADRRHASPPMDAAGVELRAAQRLARAAAAPLIANDEVAGWVAEHPDRFAGARRGRPRQADGGGARAAPLRRPSSASRACACIPWLWEAPPTDRRYYPLYAACVELGVPFCTQVGHTGPLRPSETGRPIPYIDQVAIDFPELTIVCGPHRLPVDGGDGRRRAQARERLHRHLGLHRAPLPARARRATCARAAAGARSCSAPTTR